MEFIKKMFSEEGTASFGRFGAFIALLASITWVSFVVYKKELIPDLGGISLFIGTLYGLSKGLGALQGAKNANP